MFTNITGIQWEMNAKIILVLAHYLRGCAETSIIMAFIRGSKLELLKLLKVSPRAANSQFTSP